MQETQETTDEKIWEFRRLVNLLAATMESHSIRDLYYEPCKDLLLLLQQTEAIDSRELQKLLAGTKVQLRLIQAQLNQVVRDSWKLLDID